MQMSKFIKKLLVYGTVGIISLSTLTSCGASDEREEAKTEQEQNDKEKTQYEEKTFEPYKHLFFIRTVNTDELRSKRITGGSIEIPEGYEVFCIENFNGGSSSETAGYDIWYTNTVPVKVEPIYNESLEIYDYSHFGAPILEKELEQTENIQKAK